MKIKNTKNIKNGKTLKEENNKNDDINMLTINQDYADKFDHMRRRQEIEKGEAKYGKDAFKFKFDETNEFPSSSSDSEDSSANLINDTITEKFLSTIVALNDDKKSQEFLKNSDTIFKDADFTFKGKNKIEKITTYKDTIFANKDKDQDDEQDQFFDVNYQVKSTKEEDKDKSNFLKAAEGEDYVDEGFLTIKKEKTVISQFKQEEDPLDKKELEELDLNDILIKKKDKIKDVNLLRKFWGEDQKLDKNERFLRNYILTEAWHENPNKKNLQNMAMKNVDEYDSEHEDKFDNFEAKFNFRFEEQGGANITTHQRELETYRQKDETRITKRKERDERIKKEKDKQKNEFKKIQNMKKEEIMSKISRLVKIAGTDKIKLLAEELDNEYNSEKFDKIMEKVFNEEFYNNKDKNAQEIVEDIKEKKHDFYTNSKLEFDEEIDEEENEENDELFKENNGYQDDENLKEYEDQDEPEEENEWWYCDECKNVIKEGKIKYDCETCEDFTLCKDCFKAINHIHKMKKGKVAFGAKPPKDWKELIESNVLACTNCKKEIEEDFYFRCEECGLETLKVCKTCKVGNYHKHHVLKKFKIEETKKDENSDPKTKLKNIINTAFDTHYDDIIAKNLPVKFKYTNVDKDDTGLTDDMLVYLNDKSLNKFMPLKRLAPYKEHIKHNKFLNKKRLYDLDKELESKKKEINEMESKNEDILQVNRKYITKKVNKPKIDDDRKDWKKKKRMETYGIID